MSLHIYTEKRTLSVFCHLFNEIVKRLCGMMRRMGLRYNAGQIQTYISHMSTMAQHIQSNAGFEKLYFVKI